MPDGADTYLHRVGRAGRFGTKGLAITFVSTPDDLEILNQVPEKFEVNISILPEDIASNQYSTFDRSKMPTAPILRVLGMF
ncbi:MAG: hypothetical protein BJ554DRAFT_5299 [Olpidium bornovanus]|uniref:Helicase C-terminal domain-containing protein n=1 Tax=Olpidium bornovanus TaxID=278681 RepID=A0A8H8DLM0_9FUNG|nr:MAG: hypothetical protein BJ554DRAFT_5299 [Olpidium bornovanus]